MHDTIQKTLDTVLEDNAKEGTYRVARDIFTDPEIFELEMKHIFEGNWIYLAYESQIPNKRTKCPLARAKKWFGSGPSRPRARSFV